MSVVTPLYSLGYLDPTLRALLLNPMMLTCRHVFDASVIAKLGATCPLCRRKIETATVINISKAEVEADIARNPDLYGKSYSELIKDAEDAYPKPPTMIERIALRIALVIYRHRRLIDGTLGLVLLWGCCYLSKVHREEAFSAFFAKNCVRLLFTLISS